jgi:hypothetical protein
MAPSNKLKAIIKSVDDFGLAIIEFNRNIIVKLNKTAINDTNLLLSMVPNQDAAEGRNLRLKYKVLDIS